MFIFLVSEIFSFGVRDASAEPFVFTIHIILLINVYTAVVILCVPIMLFSVYNCEILKLY